MVELCETVYYFIPKRVRHKMDPRWGIGVYLGMANNSNEHYVACNNGSVVKTRSVVRVTAHHRWSEARVNAIEGIPGVMTAANKEEDQALIEELQDPHANLSDALEQSDVPLSEDKKLRVLTRQLRITYKDLLKHGFTPGCPRCADL